MKVNPFRQVGMNPYNRQVNKTEQPKGAGKMDKVEISSEAKEMQQIPSIVKEREMRVVDLKKSVQNGSYNVDPQAVAKGIAKFYQK